MTFITFQKEKTEIEIKKHSHIKLVTDPAYKERCDSEFIFVDYPNIVNVVRKKFHIFIDDGLISLIVDDIGTALMSTFPSAKIHDAESEPCA